MKINKSMMPLKSHYFFFLGAMSPILPFAMVIVRQLGIPVVAQGSLSFFALLVTVVAKPFIGAAADAFPKARKLIFICILITLYITLSSICFLPPVNEEIVMEGQSLPPAERSSGQFQIVHEVKMLLSIPKGDACYISEAWDCMVPCDFNGNQTIMNIKHILLEDLSPLEALKNLSESVLVYKMNGIDQTSCDPYQHLKFDCKGGIYIGEGCPSLFRVGVFWAYLVLFVSGQVTYTTANSVTDAICMDSIGENGDYGAQRAWGTVGWGVMAPVSGLLIDWWSGDSYSKNYAPIIVIVLGLGLIDLTITSAKLKVPRLASGDNVWKSVGLVLKKPHVILFLLFVVMNGAFDGVILTYIFVLQEEMAKDTIYMKYMKFIQGLTLAAQCCLEAPFMWMFSWFLRKIGSVGIMKMVLFLYAIRLFLLAVIGSYGPVWAILLCELLNGPCYGLGYTAIVIQAGNITPPGTSATIQSVVNICYESIGYALSCLAGGIIFHQVGATGIYYIFSVISTITFLLYLILSRFLKQLNHKTSKENMNSEPTTLNNPISNASDEKYDDQVKIPMLKDKAMDE